MSERRERQLIGWAIEMTRLQIRKTLVAAIIPLAFLRGIIDEAMKGQPMWGVVSIVLPGLFWLTYAGIVYYATRRPS